MPLIICPDCKNSVSDSAVSCPHCGYPINVLSKEKIIHEKQNITTSSKEIPKKNNGCAIILAAIVIIGFLIFLIDIFTKNSTPESTSLYVDSIIVSPDDSIKNAQRNDSLAKMEKLQEENFLKTKAGKIYKKHKYWSKEDCEKLAHNKVWIGMEYEMLVYLRGKPNHVNTSNYGNGAEYQACWDDHDPGCFYFGENQIITSYN